MFFFEVLIEQYTRLNIHIRLMDLCCLIRRSFNDVVFFHVNLLVKLSIEGSDQVSSKSNIIFSCLELILHLLFSRVYMEGNHTFVDKFVLLIKVFWSFWNKALFEVVNSILLENDFHQKVNDVIFSCLVEKSFS